MERLKHKLKLKNLLVVECDGEGRKRRGGLALLWHDNVDIIIQSFSLNHIDAVVDGSLAKRWRFTGFIGFSDDESKHKTGTLMECLNDHQNLPWSCGGDFNLMLASHEKKGGNDFKVHEADILRRAIQVCNLLYLGYVGHDFTWTNNHGREKNLQERLDRYLANQQWKNLFP